MAPPSSLSGLRIGIVAVGRVSNVHAAGMCKEYDGWIKRHLPLTVHEVREGGGRDASTSMSAEAGHLLKQLPEHGAVLNVALDERGVRMTSASFASWLGEKRERGVREIRFVIGGAWGLDARVKARCDETMRLSDMTLPYQLTRVLMYEQIWRACTVALGVPYSK